MTELGKAFQSWFAELKRLKRYNGLPAKGTIAAALIVLERLRVDCDLRMVSHLAPGEAQIAGMSLPALQKILVRYGEDRPFPSEGGRTNRGNNAPIKLMLNVLADHDVCKLSVDDRNRIINDLQEFLVRQLDTYYALERIAFGFDPQKPTKAIVSQILAEATKRKSAGIVAQHLVGAKLACRFPSIEIANYSASAADNPGGRAGDFIVSDTAFHVTVAPTPGHLKRCRTNLENGLASYLLVVEASLTKAHVLADLEGLADRVSVESVESFVSHNIAELSSFATNNSASTWAAIVYEYNRRVSEVETDQSLLLQVPHLLKLQQ